MAKYADRKQCTRLTLLAADEDLRNLKRQAAANNILMLVQSGEIPQVGTVVYTSTHILTNNAIELAQLPDQDIIEYVIQGQIAGIHEKRIDVNIPLLQAVITMPLFRYRTYTSENIEEHQLLLTDNMLNEDILQQVRGKQSNSTNRQAPPSKHQLHDKVTALLRDGLQEEGYIRGRKIPMTPCFVFVQTLDTCLIVHEGWRIEERLQKVAAHNHVMKDLYC